MIRFENVYKSYGDDAPVLNDFNLNIERGEMVFLTGKSGSGKTTLIMLLLREQLAQRGRIVIDGRDIEKLSDGEIPFFRRDLGIIFQDFRLIPDMTVYENLYTAILATGGRKSDAEKKITDVLTMLGIDRLHKRYPKQLSGGEQQKVCLARALINNPKILLADEPTGNLDPASSKEIIKLIELVNSQGITVVMATHDIANIEETLDEKSYRMIKLEEKTLNGTDRVAS